jgi:Galactocerebrosidase, C-terminal lectin domain
MTGVSATQQPATQVVDIGSMEPGQEPPGFMFWRTGDGGAGEWRVVADPTATNQKAIAQTSKERTDYRFPLAIYKSVSATNVDVVVRFKPLSGNVDQAGGIAVRLTTPDDYYVARANALEDNVRFYRVVKGKREQLQGTNIKVAGTQWHTLGLRAEGDKFTVSFDGKPLFMARDKTFTNSGKVALWTKADSVTHFDSISITPLD